MYLVKSLNKKYRDETITLGKIRIGTINYYRKIENAERKDAEEGLGHIVWKGQELSAEDHNRIFTPFDNVTLKDGFTIKNAGVPIHGSYPNFNLFTFCYSQVERVSQIRSTSSGKASHYYFITDFPQFIRVLTKSIRIVGEEIIRKYEPKHADELIRNLKVFDVSYKIYYSDETKAREVTEENVKSFEPKKFYSQDFFQKRTSFSYEREVRTCWVFIYTDKNGRKQASQIPPPDQEFVDLEVGKLPLSKWRKKNNYPVKTSTPKQHDV